MVQPPPCLPVLDQRVVVVVAAEEVGAEALTARETGGQCPGRCHAEAVNNSHSRFA